MFYLLLIFSFLGLTLCWLVSEQNKKNLSDLEFEAYKKASFQDQNWLSSLLSPVLFSGFMFLKELSWFTPYPTQFVLTIIFAWFVAIRLNINQTKLPKKFIKIDNILFVIQQLSICGLITFLDFWL